MDAAGIGIGLAILQVPLALPLAVIVFIGAFIPIVGATVAGILAALVALVANGPVTALIVVGIVILVNQLEGNFLQPVVQARSLKLHPLVILVALTAGAILGGIVGAVLSVPFAAVAWAIVKAWKPARGTCTPVRAILRRRARATASKVTHPRGSGAFASCHEGTEGGRLTDETVKYGVEPGRGRLRWTHSWRTRNWSSSATPPLRKLHVHLGGRR